MKVLAVGAHPDDVEYSAGGTVAKYAKAETEEQNEITAAASEAVTPSVKELDNVPRSKPNICIQRKCQQKNALQFYE
jgi:hypothetical protein